MPRRAACNSPIAVETHQSLSRARLERRRRSSTSIWYMQGPAAVGRWEAAPRSVGRRRVLNLLLLTHGLLVVYVCVCVCNAL